MCCSRVVKGGWVGGGKEKGRFSKELSYVKEDLQDTRGLAIVKLRVFFFPSSKALTLK